MSPYFMFASEYSFQVSNEMIDWLEEHNCKYHRCNYFGSSIDFPDGETMLIFKLRFGIC